MASVRASPKFRPLTNKHTYAHHVYGLSIIGFFECEYTKQQQTRRFPLKIQNLTEHSNKGRHRFKKIWCPK